MGRMLGAYDSDELDRPDLNKCPDCGCFFATDACPLCGKICPENMRAGNRAAVKPPKKRRNPSGRVQFIPWYHTWWFILIMMFLFPLVGIVLFATSPYSRKLKITICILAGLLFVGQAVWTIGSVQGWFEKSPVNTSLSRTEYIGRCEMTDAETLYRQAHEEGKFVCVDLYVQEMIRDSYDNGRYNTYYVCRNREGQPIHFLIRDCREANRRENPQRDLYRPGDIVRFYGESGGILNLYEEEYHAIGLSGTDVLILLNVAYTAVPDGQT